MSANSTPEHAIATGNAPPQNPQEYAAPHPANGVGRGPQLQSTSDDIQVKCGPLLNYKRISDLYGQRPTWHGSVLIVTTPGPREARLSLRCLGPVARGIDGSHNSSDRPRIFAAERLYEDTRCAFLRFVIDLPLQEFESRWEYNIPRMRHLSGSMSASTKSFCVPSAKQSMRIMFHSCNGFSVGTDEDAWSGTPLWNDVLRNHEKLPIHVMIGGGDRMSI